jgi:hypothetical protein
MGVVHQRQGLPLCLESGDDLLRIRARLDDLDRHLAAHRPLLFCDEDDSHAALADLLTELIAADRASGALRYGLVDGEGRFDRWRLHEAFFRMCFKQRLNAPAKRQVVAADLLQILVPRLRVCESAGDVEDPILGKLLIGHGEGSVEGAIGVSAYLTVRNRTANHPNYRPVFSGFLVAVGSLRAGRHLDAQPSAGVSPVIVYR